MKPLAGRSGKQTDMSNKSAMWAIAVSSKARQSLRYAVPKSVCAKDDFGHSDYWKSSPMVAFHWQGIILVLHSGL